MNIDFGYFALLFSIPFFYLKYINYIKQITVVRLNNNSYIILFAQLFWILGIQIKII